MDDMNNDQPGAVMGIDPDVLDDLHRQHGNHGKLHTVSSHTVPPLSMVWSADELLEKGLLNHMGIDDPPNLPLSPANPHTIPFAPEPEASHTVAQLPDHKAAQELSIPEHIQ